jgi:hypothetical protein
MAERDVGSTAVRDGEAIECEEWIVPLPETRQYVLVTGRYALFRSDRFLLLGKPAEPGTSVTTSPTRTIALLSGTGVR